MSIFTRRGLVITVDFTRKQKTKIGLGYGRGAMKLEIIPKLAFGEEPDLTRIQENPLTGWHEGAKRVGALAQKLGMTLDWDDLGNRVPLTMLHIPNCQVVQQKTVDKEGHYALQLGAGDMKLKHTTKPLMGHFAKADILPKRKITEFEVTKDCMLPVGATIYAQHFIPGQNVDVQGITKGKGFQGVMKRWGFSGQPKTHGVSVSHRSLGSTGCRQSPGRVFKGKKMPGRMGNAKRTIKNLMVFKVDPKYNVVYVKGGVPGATKSWVRISDANKNEYYYQTPPYPTFVPSTDPDERVPLEIRHRYDWLRPDEWMRKDNTDPDRLAITKAEKLGFIVTEAVQPQTMTEILQSIVERKAAEEQKKKEALAAAEKQKQLQKKTAGKKKEAGEDKPKGKK